MQQLPSDTLTLYFIPSPYGISWDTPAQVARTTIRNQLTFKDRKIGHVSIEIKCHATESTKAINFFTGMTGDISPSKRLIIKDGIGLGMLFYNYEGRLENSDQLKEEMIEKSKSGRMNFLTFKINSENCRRLAQYVEEFKTKGFDRYYGLPNRPRHGEGSGCTAFGMSFLEIAGLMEEDFKKSWSHYLRVPEEYIGTPIGKNPVNIVSLALPLRNTRWANANEPHREIFFWDPDKMFEWVNDKFHNKSQHKEFEFTELNNAKGIILDRTKVNAPKEPLFKI